MEKTVHFIMYHYVRDLKNSEYPTIKGLDKELFEKQLAYLLEHYTPVRMDEILAAYQKNDFSDIPENGCLFLQLQPVVWERIAECREEGGSLRCPEGFFWQGSFF